MIPSASGPLAVAETLAWLAQADMRTHADVVARARLVLLDTLACAVAGLSESEPATLARAMAAHGPGPVSLPGAGPPMMPAAAAFVMAIAACWHEACEGLARAHGRPGLHAAPVAFGLGIARKASLGDVLEAIVWGYEIGGRAGEAMRIRPGLHVDGTWGVFAATAAAACMMRLDSALTLQALAIAACQVPTSLYAPVAAGHMARNTYVGHAAMTSIAFVESAAAGITAPADAFALAGRALAGDDTKSAWAWAPPGTFLIREGYIKPFAAVRHVHYAAACAIARFTARGGDTRDIRSLTLRTYREALTYCGNRNPRTPIQAQFSLTHGTAFALRCGGLGPEAYDASVFADAEQQRLEQMTQTLVDPAISGRGATLEVVTGAGSETYTVTSVPGDPDQPLSPEDVRRKALVYMSPVIGAAAAESIARAILDASLDEPLSLPETWAD